MKIERTTRAPMTQPPFLRISTKVMSLASWVTSWAEAMEGISAKMSASKKQVFMKLFLKV